MPPYRPTPSPILFFIAIIIPLLIAGCASSLVYSPAVKLPSRPLHKERGELIGSLAVLPETRPQAAEHRTSAGMDFTLRYGFSENLTLGLSAWTDVGDLADNLFRGGYGAEAIIPLGTDRDAYRFGLMPRAQVLFDGSSNEGWGISLPVILWFPSSGSFTNFGALGPVFGFRDLSPDPGEISQWGYGLIGNFGTSLDLGDNFRANVEVVGVIAVNEYDHITHGLLAPSIGVAWKF